MAPETTTLRRFLWTSSFLLLLSCVPAKSSIIEARLNSSRTHPAFATSSVTRERTEPLASRYRSTTERLSIFTLARPSSAEFAPYISDKAWFNNAGSFGQFGILAHSILAVRDVRVAGAPLNQGRIGSITIDMDSLGDENAIGFSLTFDTTKLTYASAVRGVDSPGTTLNVNTLQLVSGRLGLAIAFPSEQTFVAGTRHVLVVNFNVSPTASGTANIGFGDLPIGREIADISANVLIATYSPASIAINSPVPALSDATPNIAVAGGGNFGITVNGTNFVSNSIVRFAGSDLVTSFVNSAQLTALVPAALIGTAGSASVEVFNPPPGGGTSNVISFGINNPAPALSSLTPTQVGAASGALSLTVNGSGFINGSVVHFGGSPRTTSFANSSQLTADLTANDVAAGGNFAVTVENAAPGGGTSNALSLTVNNPQPSLTTISPATATTGAAGFTLTVNGTNFVSGATVKISGNNRPTTFVNSDQLTADLTAGDIAAAGSFPVTVDNPTPGGGASNAVDLAVNNPAPGLTGISPTSANAGGAAFTLSLNGSGFVSGAVARVNGSNRTTTFVDAGHLTAQITALDVASSGSIAVTVSNPAPGGGISNALTLTVNPPAAGTRALRVVNVTAARGTTVVVTIELVAQGNENAWGFSLLFDPNQLSFVTVANGDVPTASLLVNSSAAIGHIGIAGSLPAGQTLSQGAHQILTVSFAVPSIGNLSPIGIAFDDFPISREVVNVNATPLATGYTNGVVNIANGYEADVAPRPDGNGDGTVTIQDWNQVGRFMALLDDATLGSEYQRTDCSPAQTRGDGRLSVADWTQAGRYAALLDPVAFAGGPTGPVLVSAARLVVDDVKTAESVVRMDASEFRSGQTVINIGLDAKGIENAVGFSLTFDASKLSFIGAEKSIDASEAALQINLTNLNKGRIGMALALPPERAFDPGAHELLKLRFALRPGVLDANKPRFSDLPIDREVADLNANPLRTAFVQDSAGEKSPIDDPEFFVQQQYFDFLGRKPDVGGLDYWTSQIANCGPDAICAHNRRIDVSAAFFVDQEFQQTGFFVHRLFKVLLGHQPNYAEFITERSHLSAGGGQERDKLALIQAWLNRPEVQAKYPASLSNEEFVDALLETIRQGSGVDLTNERQSLIVMSSSQDRASIVRDLIDNSSLGRAEYNPAFVLAEYFGYLRRDPDPRGYQFWVNVLNERVPNNYRAMVCAFITSQEYQRRFGSVISHSNAECGP